MTTHGIAPTNGSFAAHTQKRWRLFPVLALTLAFASGGLAGVALAAETSATGRAATDAHSVPSLPLSGEQLAALGKRADGGDSRAMIMLGLYHSGRAVASDAVPRKLEEGIRWYEKAAAAGDADAMTSLGFLYLSQRNADARAVEWFRKAAAQGKTAAMSTLGLLYAQGRGVPGNERQSFAWTRKAAENDDKFAAYELSDMYLSGRGTRQDLVEAVGWCRNAAVKGLAPAMYKLSLFYGNGVGVEKDEEQAFTWALKAAQAGLAIAMADVGSRYKRGIGVPADLAEAKRWFEAGAKAGEAKAMFGLGSLHDEGAGVTADPGLAADWMVRAIRALSYQAVESIMRRPSNWSQAFREELQKRLREAGVYQGAINGKIDAATGRAIAALSGRATARGPSQPSPSDTIDAKVPDHVMPSSGNGGRQGPRPSAASTPLQARMSVPMLPNAWIRVAPHAGHVSATSQGLVLGGGASTGGQLRNGQIDGNRVRSRERFDFGAGGDVYMTFTVDGGGKYMAIYPRLVAGVSVRHMSTHNSWAGSVVVPDRTLLFGHLRIDPGGDYRLTITHQGYDDHGGRVLQETSGNLAVLSAPLEFQFGDNHAGTAAGAVITEAWVYTDGTATRPIAPSPAAQPGGSCSTDTECPGSICLLGVCAPPSPRQPARD